MTTAAWIVTLLVVVVVGAMAVLIAYSRGKGVAIEKPPQFAQAAAEQLKAQVAAAQAQLKQLTTEAEQRQAELEAIIAIADERDRLKALAAYANRDRGLT